MDAENKTGFTIDGDIYEDPDLTTLTMGERHVLYDLTGHTQEAFVQGVDESDQDHEQRVSTMTDHPGFMEAWMHIAYQRGNPTLTREQVQKVIDNTPYLDALSTLPDAEPEPEEDAVPLGLTTPPDAPSPSEPSSKQDSTSPRPSLGGTGSRTDSEGLVAAPTRIGTTRSATSSPESPEKESVA